ncbi:unnamed protein product [Notodromas monacha]|uniref:Uncharacterized protein n=1 Tax=Notodromas monacha TaxID=399045 RepID=A0A7R9BUX7_9CRUS|nr:unnamed protein product [Notodromas monacha]CAG0922194.1 unnamed protein product [Notodromas monacha]
MKLVLLAVYLTGVSICSARPNAPNVEETAVSVETSHDAAADPSHGSPLPLERDAINRDLVGVNQPEYSASEPQAVASDLADTQKAIDTENDSTTEQELYTEVTTEETSLADESTTGPTVSAVPLFEEHKERDRLPVDFLAGTNSVPNEQPIAGLVHL